jgi:hypothetical protein
MKLSEKLNVKQELKQILAIKCPACNRKLREKRIKRYSIPEIKQNSYYVLCKCGANAFMVFNDGEPGLINKDAAFSHLGEINTRIF